MAASREEIEESLAHIVRRDNTTQYIDDTILLSVQGLLGQHPDEILSSWAQKNPRLFLILRWLNCDYELFSKLESENISDLWLPLSSTALTRLASVTNIAVEEWRPFQLHVLSKPELMTEERLLSPVQAHRHILDGNFYLEELEQIGKGGSAEVTRVRHKVSGREFACKRILRAAEVKVQRAQLVEFTAEVHALKRVSHHHLVSFVASFTDRTHFSLILNPVAKDSLKAVLERQSRSEPLPDSEISVLRHTFGCLATALAYLHDKGIRHKDIKPGNILLSDGRVYLCDFGIARDWSQAGNSTTESDVIKFTRRYCAPEVFGREPRNTKSDVWSLGCVFLEILSVVKGYTMEELNTFLLEFSSGESGQGLWCALDAMNAWLVKIRSEHNDSADDVPLDWITTMIRAERDDRIHPNDLLDMILKASAEMPLPNLFVGPCCTRADSVSALDSPTLTTPPFTGLGIHNASVSPATPNLLHLPHRNSSASSRGRRSFAASNQNRTSRERSISPRTQSLHPSDSTETTSSAMEFIQPSSSTSVSSSRPLQHIASRTDSHMAGNLAPEPGSARSARIPPPAHVPLPASFPVKCSCAANPNERHILNFTYASTPGSAAFDPHIPTIETCAKCEIGENKVQVYESYLVNPVGPAAPRIWGVTRRLVVSYLSGSPPMRHCSSFWLPLADFQFRLSGEQVTLYWSDCNQMTERRSGNYSTHYDWMYDPKHMNNEITIRFQETHLAECFIDIIRLPYEDRVSITGGRKVDVSQTSEVNIFNIGDPDHPSYRVASLTTIQRSLANSTLFIQWPEADLDMRITEARPVPLATEPEYDMIVEMKNMATPTYISDTLGEPAADYKKVARFSKVRTLKSRLTVVFPLGNKHGLPSPPLGMSKSYRASLCKI